MVSANDERGRGRGSSLCYRAIVLRVLVATKGTPSVSQPFTGGCVARPPYRSRGLCTHSNPGHNGAVERSDEGALRGTPAGFCTPDPCAGGRSGFTPYVARRGEPRMERAAAFRGVCARCRSRVCELAAILPGAVGGESFCGRCGAACERVVCCGPAYLMGGFGYWEVPAFGDLAGPHSLHRKASRCARCCSRAKGFALRGGWSGVAHGKCRGPPSFVAPCLWWLWV